MAKAKRFDVISPDGIPINQKNYATLEDAIAAFKKWAKRFEFQGYYSCAKHGRIDLRDLEDYCEFVEI
jgi:hypothetical protein